MEYFLKVKKKCEQNSNNTSKNLNRFCSKYDTMHAWLGDNHEITFAMGHRFQYLIYI